MIIITAATTTTTTTMIIELKGAIRDFFLQSPHRATNRLQHIRSSGSVAIVCKIMCNTSSAYQVQHFVLRVTWYEGTAQL